MTIAPPHPPPGGADPDESNAIDEAEPPQSLKNSGLQPAPESNAIDEAEPPQSLKNKVLQPRWRTKSLHEQRFDLARMLLYVVGGLAAALLVACVAVPVDRLEAIQSLAPVIFGPLVTLFGTSVAWYYATDKSEKSDKNDNLQ
jgi:hypothetical protein